MSSHFNSTIELSGSDHLDASFPLMFTLPLTSSNVFHDSSSFKSSSDFSITITHVESKLFTLSSSFSRSFSLSLAWASGNFGERVNTGATGNGGLIGIVTGFTFVVCLMIFMIILYSRRSDTSLDEHERDERDDASDELSIETDESMETGEFDLVFDDQLVYANPLSGDDFISCDCAAGFTEIGFDETGL
jgi:hypothetical protein